MPPDLPPGRYDTPRRRTRVLAGLVAGLLGVAALMAAYSLYTRYNEGRLDAQLIGYDVTSDSLVRITFEVVNGDRRAECKVRARDRTGAEAGARLVQVAAADDRAQSVTVDLPTRTRAVNGELVGCRAL
ncbi:MAG: DUF4307 domain-containing protein [Frankiaceae bacterium]|nr:DUF4307 domain-containing protein [Frankiaceae bacterium]